MDNGYEVVVNSYIPLGCLGHWLASAHVGHLAQERGRRLYHDWMAPRSCDAHVIVQ